MSVKVMTLVWSLDLPDSQKIVLLALADCANDEGHCWPSMASLSRKCSKSDRTVQRVIQQLEAAGHVTRDEKIGRGCNYWVHPRRDVAPKSCRPDTVTPRKDDAPPPTPCRQTPDTVSDKPSRTVKEPSNGSAPDDALTPENFVEDWNDLAAGVNLVPIRKLSDARRRKLNALIKKHGFDEIAEAFAAIRRCSWMHGTNDRGWRANITWFLRPDTITRLIEGEYEQQKTTH